MRAHIAFAAALLALPATAMAQEAPQARGEIIVSGIAPSACLVRGAARGTGSNAVLGTATDRQADIQILQLVDPETSVARATSMSLSLPIVCNVGHRIILRAQNGGLTRSNAAGGSQATPGFRETVPYELSASWAGVSTTSGSGSTVDLAAPDAAAGDLTVDIDIPGGGAPLVAGTYSDLLVVELRVVS